MRRIRIVILVVMLTISLSAHIKNANKPLKGKWDFQMKKMWEVEEAGDYDIAVVQNLDAANDGSVYILDQKNYKIYIFSKEGKFITAFGKRGEGPGEIMRLFGGAQLYVVNNNVIIADLNKIHYWALDGTFKQSVPYPANLGPRTFLSEDVFISAPPVIRDPRKKGKMIIYNTKEKSEKIVTEYDTFDKAADRQRGRSIVVTNITPMMFVNSGNKKMYYGMSALYEITIADNTGKKIGSFSIDGRERKSVSQSFVDSIRKELKGMEPETRDRILKALPKKASFFSGITIGKNGLVYIYVSDPDSLTSQAFDIFSPEGKFLYSSEVKIADGHKITVVYLKDNLLLMGVEDDEGIVKVVKYEVKVPTL
jgi:hypothetical protein